MRAFVINLDTATDRWTFVQQSFAHTRLALCRVSAIDATFITLPHRDYSEALYRWFHGRMSNPRELACYLSHLKAMKAFLDTSDTHAMIAEDDIVLEADAESAIEGALNHAQHWNILRLTGLSHGHPLPTGMMSGRYSLSINLGRLKGCGAYLVDRRAAKTLVEKLLPMGLPYDHAIDREWRWGLRAASLVPHPVSQTSSEFLSSVQPGIYAKLWWPHRYLGTYPYQAVNELCRWLFRGSHYLALKLTATARKQKRG